jgi:hypothetical protein
MYRRLSFAASLSALALAGLLAGGCSTTGNSLAGDAVDAVAEGDSEPAPPPKTDPAAIEALDRMAAYLQTLQSFEIVAETEKDEVLPDGQKIQISGTNIYKVRRPTRFKFEFTTDRKVRHFFYDGKNFTIWAPRNKMYAQTAAPGTIREVMDELDAKYDLDTPLVDLFYWGTERVNASNVESAIRVGYSRMNGKDSDHYAFRGKEVDFQVWIQRGKQPLPLKMVITSWQEDDSPQYAAELSWKTSVKWPDSTFVFSPPKGAQRIPINEVPVPGETAASDATPTQ